jgi:hypothetical protein
VPATIAAGNNTEDVKAINVRTADLRLFAAHYNNHLVGENHLFHTLVCKKPPNKPKILTRTHNIVFPLSLSLSLSVSFVLCTHTSITRETNTHARERERERERERGEATCAKYGD